MASRLPAPPAVEAIPVADDYFGTKITDNYRWLEDAKSAETRAFIDAENAYTARYLKQARSARISWTNWIRWRTSPRRRSRLQRGDSVLFSQASGRRTAVFNLRAAWIGRGQRTERLIDPAKLSRDANTSVVLDDVSRDGTLLAYGVQQGGADETTVHVFNVKTGKTLEDELPAARYFGVTFAPDGASLYYARNNSKERCSFSMFWGRGTQGTR